MRGVFVTAGERVELDCSHRWLAGVLAEGALGLQSSGQDAPPDLRVTVEESGEPFETDGWEVLTRGSWRRPGQVLVADACSSGLDVLVSAGAPTLHVTARWRPSVTGRAATTLLRARARLLIRAVLLQYPALWWSQQRGRAPLHASVCTIGSPEGRRVLIAGPGGVGKSTLVDGELARGGQAATDNLCVSDGHTAWGLLEPRRVPAGDGDGGGRRMPHGRREAPWTGRVDSMEPDLLLVLRRGDEVTTTVVPCSPQDAARSLVAGTFMAGELRRYWAFAATLGLGTGLGAVHPPVELVARSLTTSLPCREVRLGRYPGTPLAHLLTAAADAEAWGQGVRA